MRTGIYSQFSRPEAGLSVLERLGNLVLLAGSAIVLAACEGDTSGEIAQDPPWDERLAQCEVRVGGVVGTPTDPVTVGGVETRACQVNTDAGQVPGGVELKDSYNYEPLVWVLDGEYEIGESKSYGTLAEFRDDDPFSLSVTGTALYAREGTVVVIHRNGSFSGNIESVDDNNTGGGEWAGVVVNGIGWHPDCGAGAGADDFCNLEGDWGYFGGLSQAETADSGTILDSRTGFGGYVAEAGGEPAGNIPLSAAVTYNAPHFGQSRSPRGSFYSAADGVDLNGGALGLSGFYAMGNEGRAIRWRNGFAGQLINGVIHHAADATAIEGEYSSASADGAPGVAIKTLTLVDRSLSAGTAIALSGGGDIGIDNVVVQGFDSCLSLGDSMTGVEISNSVFYCGDTTAPADDGSDYAQQAIADATNFYTLNPDLTPALQLDNDAISGITPAAVPGGTSGAAAGYEFSLYYDACYGVGTPLEETVDIGLDTYGICELSGEIASGLLYFDDDINGEPVAWRINGDVTLGVDFAELDAAQQQDALAEPQKVIMDGTSKILVGTGSSLTLNPGVDFRVLGTAKDPVELQPREFGESWDGITINGLADSCAGTAVCELARQQFVNIDYLRILNAGSGQPAFTLNEVSAGGRISHLDIADSATDGLALNGGAVNIDRLLVSGAVGDGVSWSRGYRGTLQYAILQSGEQGRGHALHGRNNSEDHDADPRSRPVMASITMKGSEGADTAILLEEGSGLLLYNSVAAEFNTCLDIDDQATADLQYSDPLQIFFDNVVLDCGAGDSTLPPDNEVDGHDFAEATRSLGGVYEVAAVLDSNFVATGPEVPSPGSGIDLSLAGNRAIYLDASPDYMGSVRDSLDDWYLGWSDSAGVLLAAECDFQGVLEDDYVYRNTSAESVEPPEVGEEVYSYYKVCGLRGTITEDFVLTAYTGVDRVAVENGEMVTEELYPGYTIEREPAVTLWLLNGMVRIGEGHVEITDPAQLEAMKADPVTLGIEASSVVMSTAGGGLHITRGGRLVVLGGESLYGDVDTDTSGPANLIGLIDQPGLGTNDVLPGSPVHVAVRNWKGIIVDGFARNNQCPEAMADPGSNVCNIEGEFGYYGGYDDDHSNLEIENLHMLRGSLRLNSVGRGGVFENFYFGLGAGGYSYTPADWGENFGGSAIDIDGGTVNLRNLNIGKAPGNAIRWNHGYRGTVQNAYIQGDAFVDIQSFSLGDFVAPLHDVEPGSCHAEHTRCKADPAILGRNGSSGQEDAVPRSMPTLANISVFGRGAVMPFASLLGVEPPVVDFSMIELSAGTGLNLYNSVVGSAYSDTAEAGIFPESIAAGQCLSVDQGARDLLGEGIVFSQVAFGCEEVSSDLNLVSQLQSRFSYKIVVNNPNNSADSTTISKPSQANSEIYEFNWGQGLDFPQNHVESVPGLSVFNQWESNYYPSVSVIDLGSISVLEGDSESREFMLETDYFGALDYFLPIDEGRKIQADSL